MKSGDGPAGRWGATKLRAGTDTSVEKAATAATAATSGENKHDSMRRGMQGLEKQLQKQLQKQLREGRREISREVEYVVREIGNSGGTRTGATKLCAD